MSRFLTSLKRLYLLTIFFAITSFGARATVYTAVVSGNFNSSLTWGGSIPGTILSTDAVIIPPGITVNLTANETFSGTSALTVNGALTSAAGTALIMTSGGLSGIGTITVDSVAMGLISGFSFTGSLYAKQLTSLGANISSLTNITVSKSLYLNAGALNITTGSITMGNNSWIKLSGGSVTTSGLGFAALDSTYNVLYSTASATSGLELHGSGLDSVTVNVPGAVTLSGNDTINGVLTLTAGTLALNGHTLVFNGSGNISSLGSGTLSGTTTSNLVVNTTGSLTGALNFATGANMLNNLTMNTTSGGATLGSDVALSGILTLSNGALSLNGHTLTLNATADLSSAGTGTLTGSTSSNLIVNTTSSLTGALRFTTGGNLLNNLTVNTGAGTGVVLSNDLGLNGVLTLTGGTLTLNGHTLTLNSTADLSAAGTGTLTGSTTSNIIVNTTGSLTGALRFATGGNMLSNLTVNTGSGSGVTLGGDLNMNGMLTLTGGTLTLNGHTLTLNSTADIATTGTGMLTGSSTSNIIVNTTGSITGGLRFATGGNLLNNLTVNTGSGSNVSLGSDVSLDGMLTLSNGTLSLNGHTLTLNTTGNIAGSGTGTITGSTTGSLVINTTGGLTNPLRFTTGGSLLDNLTLNTGGTGGATLSADLGLSGMLTLTGGTLSLNGHTLTLNSAANIASSGTGTLTGNATSNIIVNTTGSLTGALRFATGGNLLNNLTVNTGSGSGVTLGGDLGLNGMLTLTGGTLTLNGHTLTLNAAANIAATGTGTLTGSSTSDIIVNATSGLTGTLRFATGGSQINNLTINTGSGSNVSLGSDINLDGMLTLTNGALALNSYTLTLNATGNIAGTGTGTITGGPTGSLVVNTTGGLTSPLRFTTGTSALNNLTLNTGGTGGATLSSDLGLSGMLTLTGGTLSLNGHTLTLNPTANVTAGGAGSITGTTTSNIVVNTTGSVTGALQFATGGNMLSNLTINMGASSDTINLGSNLTVNGMLNLQTGMITLGNNNLDVAAGGMIYGGTTGSYVATTGSGSLIMNLAAGNTDTFKVGTLADFAPMVIAANSGSATGDVSINVMNGVYSAGTTGTLISSTNSMVNATWMVSSTAMTSGINYNMTAMWNAGMEVNGFDRMNSFISHYHSAVWDTITASFANTFGAMYTQTRTGITSLSPFMVADRNTFTTAVANINAAPNAEISLYPNPTLNTLNFSANVESVNVYDVYGKQVMSVNGSVDQVSVQDLPAGTYLVNFKTNNTTSVRKFVKE